MAALPRRFTSSWLLRSIVLISLPGCDGSLWTRMNVAVRGVSSGWANGNIVNLGACSSSSAVLIVTIMLGGLRRQLSCRALIALP
uniref:Uncharacterized protein n=1 Tax=Anopheles darlingi TaxID=43151 RepID=A0A2M4D9V0_ANODA